jgi:hypothetical protein
VVFRSRVAVAIVLAALVVAAPVSGGAPGPFQFSASRLSAGLRERMRHDSWRPGCPVSLDDLRLLRMSYLVDDYGASDYVSIANDNTSSFNCRNATGSTSFSQHAYGRAIDINPIENPYVYANGTTTHPPSKPYLDRSHHRRGMAFPGGVLVRAFDAVGWGWGGRWPLPTDYQHFSRNGH